MNGKLQQLVKTAKQKTWVSFTHENDPYSLLHWSVAGPYHEAKDVWLLQNEMTFETKEFPTLEAAIAWLGEHMPHITEVL
ncbi:YqkC family protein [Geobacillus proteiniphilus]|uniref:YqkC family protein n=1 Tax=Geobacillus proteiniphilus TaxID=860353 RepID=A0A1Q5SR93_9BACL|nr:MULTISPECIES: YqkC family protein [Geobacillus]OKO90500.1 hypothetical protein BRO54_3013 [Geobacillus proteiniphilus]OPX01332.1 hypothetical protein B1A75_16305 [Geobacillus sp. LEMMY01]WMJ17310.1 YqkC family protein [Geobacillus proteiniphilus]